MFLIFCRQFNDKYTFNLNFHSRFIIIISYHIKFFTDIILNLERKKIVVYFIRKRKKTKRNLNFHVLCYIFRLIIIIKIINQTNLNKLKKIEQKR
jgi:hypothetical protein